MNKLDGKSMDIVSDNVEKLKELFPEVFSEGKIDFDKLKEELGSFTDKENERYNFTWNGKQEAKHIAQTPSTGTLRPCKEDSKDWDTTQNLYIEGDNLEVLKLLQKSYHKKVKMIYIDPPYNTGKDFVYKDNFKDNIKNYMEQTGQVDSDGNRLSTNSDTNGRYHSDWLSMMYPRLKLARNLLKDDGVVFISIDDNEIGNLRKLCDEVFGEDNFIAELTWEKKKKGTFLSNNLTNIKESILVYAKSKALFNGLIGEINTDTETYPCINASNKRDIRTISKGIISKFRESNYFLAKGSEISVSTMSLKLHSDLIIKNNILMENLVIEGNWRYTQVNMENYAKEGDLYITQDLYIRRIVREARYKTLKDLLPRLGTNTELKYQNFNLNNLFEDGWGSNEDGEEELRLLLNGKSILEFPKPTKLIKKLIASVRDEDSLILDFFSGSATTAHAVMQLNSVDNGNRQYIMVQLPEKTDNKDFSTICEIGKERIRRAGEKIKADNPDKDLSNLDIGFKVYKLDSSNIKEWDSDFDNLETNLLDSVDNIKPDRTSEELLYEILLKYGLDLTLPIEEKTIEGKTVYNIGFGALVVCLDDNITIEVVEAIAEFVKEQVVYDEEKKKRHARVVFKDKSFADTNVKTNAIQVLKQFDIDEVVSV